MKSRPRRAENEIAEHLSEFFTTHNLSPVERIPILGRTGPDLTINESGLVIDVKSRQTCPVSYFSIMRHTGKARNEDHTAFELDHLDEMFTDSQYMPLRFSKMVDDWLNHMDEWTQENTEYGISAVVIHRPQMPYGGSVLVVRSSDVGLLKERIIKPNIIRGGDDVFIRFVDGMLRIHRSDGETIIPIRGQDLKLFQSWIQED
jgi:hypothetical protein